MRSVRIFLGTMLVGVVALVAGAGPAGAAKGGPVVYTGAFSGPVVYSNCESTAPAHIAAGTWSMTLHGATAKGFFDIKFVESGTAVDHVTYSFPGMKAAPVASPYLFAVSGTTQAGPLTVKATADVMTYVISPYSFDGLVCERVTYSGSVST